MVAGAQAFVPLSTTFPDTISTRSALSLCSSELRREGRHTFFAVAGALQSQLACEKGKEEGCISYTSNKQSVGDPAHLRNNPAASTPGVEWTKGRDT